MPREFGEVAGPSMASVTLDWQEVPPAAFRGGAVTVGNFDGVHRGHAALVAETKARAQAVGGPAVVLTFDPHPLRLLAPDRFRPLLTTPADRAELLHAAGADGVLFLRTTPDLLALSPEAFFEEILRKRLRAQAVVEGFNFRFGHERAGTVETLRNLCGRAGVDFREVPPLEWQGMPLSSSRVREALLAGDVLTAAGMLGRPHRLRGRVGEGARRGRTIGFPTANLEGVETVLPAEGVYAVRADVDGHSWPAAANVGPNPTFGEQARKVEVHLIDFAGDLYGRELAVDFVARLRETRPFANAGQLVEQLRRDVQEARRALGT